MSQQKESVQKSVKEVEEVIDLFYQQKLQEALNKFESVLGNIYFEYLRFFPRLHCQSALTYHFIGFF